MKEILFYTEGVDFPDFFSEASLLPWFDEIAEHYKVELGEISFIFCNDEHILEVNKQYLQHDYYTDVITFDYCVDGVLNGDIFISLDTVKSNAEEYGASYETEYHRVLCHSLLHLIGYKDKTDKDAAEMRANEEICLNLFK